MTRALAGLAVALASCANLANVSAPGTCGNYVVDVDKHEDCDAGPNGSTWCTPQCQLRCQPAGCVDGTGTIIPNYRCGVDGLCRAPGGSFPAESGSFAFQPVNAVATDIDHDGIADLVGLTLDTEVVHFGDRAGLLSREVSTLVPSSSGVGPSFGDFDGDGSLDALVPTPDGIAAVTSSANIPLPFPFANSLGAVSCDTGNKPRGVLSLDDTHNVLIVAKDTGLMATVLDLSNTSCSTGFQPVCGFADPAQMPQLAVTLSGYVTTGLTSPKLSAIVAVSDGTRVCPLTIVQNGGVFQITSGPPITRALFPGTTPVLAQLDGAVPACPDLLLGDMMGTWKYSGAGGAAGCSITTTSSVQLASGGTIPSGRARVVPQIAGAGPDAIALTAVSGIAGVSAIFASTAAGPQVLYQSAEGFSSITSADLDGDGTTEIIVTARFAPDLQILYRAKGTDTFLLDRIPTTGTPTSVVIGDYDGNGLPDIALVEALNGSTRLEVAYSTTDRPLPPVPIASFTNLVYAVLPIETLDSIDPAEKAEDLAVLQGVPDVMPPHDLIAAISVFHGSAQRAMSSFFDPRPPNVAKSGFASVVAGQFFPKATNDPMNRRDDLIAFEDFTDPVTGNVFGWEVANSGGGLLDTSRMRQPIGGLVYDSVNGCSPSTTLCANAALYTPIRLGDRDIVIGVDALHHLATLDPHGAPAFVRSDAIANLGSSQPVAGTVVYRPVTADLTGDGRPELVLPFRSRAYQSAADAALIVCSLADDGTIAACENLQAPGEALEGYECSDAGAGYVSLRNRDDMPLSGFLGRDLVAVCHRNGADAAQGTVLTLTYQNGAYTITSQFEFPAIYLQIADVTGDGVDDLMLLQFLDFNSEPAIHVFAQCDSRFECGGQP